MNFFLSSGYKDIRKEAGHLWTGYCYILFFFISGAFFASIFSTVPVDHKWGQTNFMPLNALKRPSKFVFFYISGFLKITYAHPRLEKIILYTKLGPLMP